MPLFFIPYKVSIDPFPRGDKQVGVLSITFDELDQQARPSGVHGSSAVSRTVASREPGDRRPPPACLQRGTVD